MAVFIGSEFKQHSLSRLLFIYTEIPTRRCLMQTPPSSVVLASFQDVTGTLTMTTDSLWFSLVPPVKYRNGTVNYITTVSFHILSYSLLNVIKPLSL